MPTVEFRKFRRVRPKRSDLPASSSPRTLAFCLLDASLDASVCMLFPFLPWMRPQTPSRTEVSPWKEPVDSCICHCNTRHFPVFIHLRRSWNRMATTTTTTPRSPGQGNLTLRVHRRLPYPWRATTSLGEACKSKFGMQGVNGRSIGP